MTADPESTRRGLLKAGAATLAAVASTSTAGCFATLPPLGGKVDFGSVDPPSIGDPSYRKWIPHPSEFAGASGDALPAVVHPAAFASHVYGHRYQRHVGGRLKAQVGYFGLGWEHYDAVVDYGLDPLDPTYALVGSVDVETVAGTLTDCGYERTDSYRGYQVYELPDVAWTAALDDRSVLWSSGDHARDHLETVVDARAGDVDRYHERDEDFRTLSNAAGASSYADFTVERYTLDVTEESQAAAKTFRFDDENVVDRVFFVDHYLYPEGEVPSADEVRRAYRDEYQSRSAKKVEVTTDGRLVTVELELSDEGFQSYFPELETDTTAWPQVSWGIDHDRDAQEVTVTHEAGEPVDATNLRLELGEKAVGEVRDAQFADRYDAVTVGDGVTVDVSDAEADDEFLLLSYFYQGVGGVGTFTYELFDDG